MTGVHTIETNGSSNIIILTSNPQDPKVVQSVTAVGEDQVSKQNKGEIDRGSWGGQLEFILTMVGYAVGLGNVWRFPFLVFRNGGATFLIPYLLMLIFVGFPVFYHEVSFGQFASLGPVTIWKAIPIWKGLGYSMVSVAWVTGLYYNVVICYAIYFLFSSMTSKLPWTDCSNDWNDCACIASADLKRMRNCDNSTELNETLANCSLVSSYTEFESPSDQFFYKNVLKMSSGIDEAGTIVWPLALSLLLSSAIIFAVLIRGIESLGKVMYVVTIFPYLMLTILLVNAATLPGSLKGVEYYLTPDFERLADGTVWADAATQIFYSLSACTGGLIAMSSYNKFDNNCYRDSLLVPVINCCTSVYAGFLVFATLGFMSEQKGVPIDEVAEGGPGLVFIVYPEAISQMPLPQFWAILFFLMLIFLGFSSEFSEVETLFVTVMDEFPHIFRKTKIRPIIFRAVFISIFYLLTLPMITEGGYYLFNLVDGYLGGFPLIVIGMLEMIALQWVYGFKRYAEDVELMLGKKPAIWFTICWVGITPLALCVIICFKSATYEDPYLPDYVYPSWSRVIGWMIVAFTMFWVPVMAIQEVIKNGAFTNFMGAIKKSVEPHPDWGPADPKNRKGRYALEPSEPPIEIYTVNQDTRNKYFDNIGYEMH